MQPEPPIQSGGGMGAPGLTGSAITVPLLGIGLISLLGSALAAYWARRPVEASEGAEKS